MILDNVSTWAVQITLPPGSIDAKGAARRWAHNDTITVVAADIKSAIAMIEGRWPSARVWAVNHVGSRTVLMVDPAMATPSGGQEG